MTTNEERCKIAEEMRQRMREGYSFYGELIGGEIGIDKTDYDDPEKFSEDCWNRLAELIEPEPERTCHAVEDVSIGGYVSWRCSECAQPINKADNYCSNCGVSLVTATTE